MGWTARQLDAVTLWEFIAAWTGYLRFNSAPKEEETPPEMSDERLKQLGIVGFA